MLALLTTPDSSIGPINLTGKPPRVTAHGVEAAPGTMTLPRLNLGQPTSKWIWRDDAGASPKPTRFRKVFDLDAMPRESILRASADVSYRLWINGHLVARGPADPGRDYDTGAPGPWFDDVRTVTRFLKAGRNVIAAEVFPKNLVQSEGHIAPGLKVLLTSTVGGKRVEVATDPTWRAAVAPDLANWEGENGYRVEAKLEPVGWQGLDFDDSAWGPSVSVGTERAENLVSELAPPLEAIVPPTGSVRFTDGVTPHGLGGAIFAKDGGYAVRYPRVMSARVALRVIGKQGARLLVMPNESEGPGFHRRMEIVLRDGPQTVEFPFFDSFSTINIEARGVVAPIVIEEVRSIFTSYPVRYEGAFECDREDLNRIWKVGRWVTQICMQTHHLDSPHHQEPISDPGDYLIIALNNYYMFGSSALARQDLRKYARTMEQRQFQVFHTSYSLLWLRMLMEYADYTGDVKLLDELAPFAHKLLDRFATYVGKNGLISNAPNYMFMDWVEIGGFNAHHPPAVVGQGYMTALYYQALEDDRQLALRLGDKVRAAANEAKRTQVRAAFERELWNAQEGLYRDGRAFQTEVKPNQWLPADVELETFSTQVNAFAVSCGLATGPRAKAVMQRVMARKDLNCQPYFMHFVFEALAKAGLFEDHALAQMGRWKILPDSQSFFEMWNTGDRSHAWNATPVFQMSGRILGVTPLKPGFAEFAIDPRPSGLRWAKGKVPTPHGPITVSWTSGASGLKLEFSVPRGTVAMVRGKQYGPGKHGVSW
ncbi:MAG: alpha-L-rhamnosidase C-terminal domain-containing protein [Fimbriimonas sp.]